MEGHEQADSIAASLSSAPERPPSNDSQPLLSPRVDEERPATRAGAVTRFVAELLRRSIVTSSVLFVLLVVSVASGSLWQAASAQPWYESVAYGLPAFEAGRWWTPLTGTFLAAEPSHYLPILILIVGGLGWAERQLGARRAVVIFAAGQLFAVVGTALLLLALRPTGWPWAAELASQLDVGPSGGAFACAAAATAALRAPWRLRARLALGAWVPIAALYLSEIVSARVRGRFVLVYELSFPCGLMFAGMACTWALPLMGWRPLYWLGSVPLLLAVLVYAYVPESARWLAARGQFRRAQACMAHMERATGCAVPEPMPVEDLTTAGRRASVGWRQLFNPGLRHASASVAALWFLGYLVNFALLIWLPSLYVEVFSTSLAQALNFALLSNVAGLAGCMAGAGCVDRIGRVPLLFGGYLGAGLSLVLIALTVAAQQVLLVALLAASCSFFLYAANMSLHLYTPELYPTLLRGKGAAWGALCNRSGALLGSIGMGWLLAWHWGAMAIFILLGGLLLLASAIALQARETKGRALG